VPGTTDERLTPSVLLGAGRFPDDQPLSFAATDAEDTLRAAAVERALGASQDFGTE
jgi:hypothetical protein